MKNTAVTILICTTTLFIGLMVGTYIGRSNTRNYIELSYAPTTYPDGADSEYLIPSIQKLDINKATADELMMLPGIGEKTAERIIAYREAHGAFYNISDLKQVQGISDSLLEKIKDYIKA